MTIQLLLFASLRERLGVSQEQLNLPDTVTNVHTLLAHLRQRGPQWAEALAEGQAFRVAVNQAMAQPHTPVAAGAEVAVFPPVTGG